MVQFIVLLSEVKVVVNTRPLTFVYEELESGFSLTPAHFLNFNLRCFPLIDDDIGYCPSEDSMTVLLNVWKKGQRQLNSFWDMWRNEYLASLREASPFHKAVKNQIQVEPRVGEVVLIKEDKIPRGMWKLGRIEKLSKGKDDNIRSATAYLSNVHRVQRAGGDPGGGLWGLETPPPPPKHIREAKGMMCCYKNT